MSLDAPPDCRRCGVCCFSVASQYVAVAGNDWRRLGAEGQALADFDGHRAHMRMRDGHCAALEIRREPDAGGIDFFCRIYDRRPQVCRELDRGSPQCAGERVRKAPDVARRSFEEGTQTATSEHRTSNIEH